MLNILNKSIEYLQVILLRNIELTSNNLGKKLFYQIKFVIQLKKIFSSLSVAVSLSFLMDDAAVYRTMFIDLFDYHRSDSINTTVKPRFNGQMRTNDSPLLEKVR